MKRVLGGAMIAVMSAVAWASEFYDVWKWQTGRKIGELIWETDSGDMSVFRSGDGNERYYVTGLAGVGIPQGTFEGFYVDYAGAGRGPCPNGTASDHLGGQIPHWGRLRMEWYRDEGGEPVWAMYFGLCNGPISPEPIVSSYQAH